MFLFLLDSSSELTCQDTETVARSFYSCWETTLSTACNCGLFLKAPRVCFGGSQVLGPRTRFDLLRRQLLSKSSRSLLLRRHRSGIGAWCLAERIIADILWGDFTLKHFAHSNGTRPERLRTLQPPKSPVCSQNNTGYSKLRWHPAVSV